MSSFFYYSLNAEPGIQRDGTAFDSKYYIDGQWVRFYGDKKRPMKMGGYKLIDAGNEEIISNLYTINKQNSIDLYMGRPSTLIVRNFDPTTAGGLEYDRTPSGFTADANNTWKFATYSITGNDVYIVANAVANANDINTVTPRTVYYGDIDSSTALTPLLAYSDAPLQVTGGITTIGRYLFYYTKSGFVGWNSGTGISGNANWNANDIVRIGAENVVYGAPTRSGSTLGGIFWTLDSVYQATQNGNSNTFNFTPISTNTSILSSNCVVNYDPYFFWVGTDSFYVYNGTVKELPNSLSKLFFFNNININAREKVTGFAMRKFGEVWWLFPKGNSTVNNHAIIYNVLLDTWYDTPINRSCGIGPTSQFSYPIMADSSLVVTNPSPVVRTYPLWVHEFGLDRIQGSSITAIPSYIQFPYLNMSKLSPNSDNPIRVDTFIPDVVQEEDMQLIIEMRGYPHTPEAFSSAYTFSSGTQFLSMNDEASLLSFKLISNAAGGNYLLGDCRAKCILSENKRQVPEYVNS